MSKFPLAENSMVFPTLQRGVKSARTQKINHNSIRSLLGTSWLTLPLSTQRRFAKFHDQSEPVTYKGTVTHTKLSRVGWCLAQLLRLIGAPLPLHTKPGPAMVSVSPSKTDAALGGQCWTRLYSGETRFPQVISSVKRFRGKTGLEEYLGFGLAIALKLKVHEKTLVFNSAGYYWFGIPLPSPLTPTMQVIHREEENGQFSFALRVHHQWCGNLVEQLAFFKEQL